MAIPKHILPILEELYDIDPSLKNQEAHLVRMIDVFLKNPVSVSPDSDFKKHLKQKLLRHIKQQKQTSNASVFSNLKILSSLLTGGVALYGVFFFFGNHVTPLENVSSPKAVINTASLPILQQEIERSQENIPDQAQEISETKQVGENINKNIEESIIKKEEIVNNPSEFLEDPLSKKINETSPEISPIEENKEPSRAESSHEPFYIGTNSTLDINDTEKNISPFASFLDSTQFSDENHDEVMKKDTLGSEQNQDREISPVSSFDTISDEKPSGNIYEGGQDTQENRGEYVMSDISVESQNISQTMKLDVRDFSHMRIYKLSEGATIKKSSDAMYTLSYDKHTQSYGVQVVAFGPPHERAPFMDEAAIETTIRQILEKQGFDMTYYSNFELQKMDEKEMQIFFPLVLDSHFVYDKSGEKIGIHARFDTYGQFLLEATSIYDISSESKQDELLKDSQEVLGDRDVNTLGEAVYIREEVGENIHFIPMLKEVSPSGNTLFTPLMK